MSDVFSKSKRSEVMSRIRSRGNKETEIKFARLLRQHHISGWRRHRPLSLSKITGKIGTGRNRRSMVRPDFVFLGPKLAVFIDGCFWHGCPLHGTKPAGNREFWQTKLESNQARDRHVNAALRRQNWKVLRIWEHQLRQGDRLMEKLKHRIATRIS
jgi:DNA mismatch endonuclease, patch repair protein